LDKSLLQQGIARIAPKAHIMASRRNIFLGLHIGASGCRVYPRAAVGINRAARKIEMDIFHRWGHFHEIVFLQIGLMGMSEKDNIMV
jgi:hypothetical protein